MLGLKLLFHSIMLVARNRNAALRISSPLIVVLLVSPVLFGLGYLQDEDVSSISIAELAVQFLLHLFASLWLAVAWHRFILLEEDRGSIIPQFNASVIGSYLVQSIKLFLFMFVVGIGFVLVLTVIFVLVGFDSMFTLMGFGMASVLLWFFYRISPVLPATALGLPATFKGAWQVTKDYSGAIGVLVVATTMVSFVAGAATQAVLPASPFAYLALSSIQIWFSAMIGVSILTTIFGVSVEKRDL